MAAAVAAHAGAAVVLIEKNAGVGKKLLLTGGGRCNVTNADPDRHRLVAKYGPHGQALHSPFSRFGSVEMRELLASLGVDTVVEDEYRVFPATHRASTIRDALVRHARAGGVELRTRASATGLVLAEAAENDGLGRCLTGVSLDDGSIVEADAFILATGGTSRPDTGSTGDGFRWLECLGHTVRTPEPALVPMRVREPWVADLQGISRTDAKLTALLDGSRIGAKRGKLLFTHFGLSGPLALNMAQSVNEAAQGGPIELRIDFFPASDGGELDRLIQERFAATPSRIVRNCLEGLLPLRLLDTAVRLARIDAATTGATITRDARKRLVHCLSSMSLRFDGLLGAESAVVSSGGVLPSQIAFSTMASRLVDNLHIVGDMLDFERQSGGYSLQLCWSTGFVAGTAAAGAASGRSSEDYGG